MPSRAARRPTPGDGCSGATCSRRCSGPRRRRTCSSASCWSAWTRRPEGVTCSGSSTSATAPSTGSRAGPSGWPGTLLADDARGESGRSPPARAGQTDLPGGRVPVPRLPGPAGDAGRAPDRVPQAEEPADPVLPGRVAHAGRLRLPGQAHGRPPGRAPAQRRDRRRLPGRHPGPQPGQPRRHFRHDGHGQVQPPAGARGRGDGGQRPLRAAAHRPARRAPCGAGAPPLGRAGPADLSPIAVCPNTSTLRISLAELSVDDLRTAYEWSRPQEEALHELERHYSVT